MAKARLSSSTITAAALAALEDVGLSGLTVRVLATRVDTAPSALYWHVKDKQELLDRMATAMLREMLTSTRRTELPQDWEEFTRRPGHALRANLLAHRDGARVFSGSCLTDDDVLGALEVPLQRFTSAGFTLRDAVRNWQAVQAVVTGFVIEEQGVRDHPDGTFDPDRRRGRLDVEAFPLTAAAGPELFGHADERFAHGLELLLRGMRPG